jgi:hypothetical protein
MKKFINKKLAVVIMFAAFLTSACGSYYKVADPASGNLYYTEKVERNGSAVVFKDGRSGSQVTLQNSEVSEISKDEYKAGLKAPKVQAK